MNLLLLQPGDFMAPDLVRVADRRAEHLLDIVKIKVGDHIDAGLLDGKIGSAQVVSIEKPAITLLIRLLHDAPKSLPITLLMALPRPLMLKRTLQSVTALGVKEIHLLGSAGVEKSSWNSHDLEEKTIREQLLLGLEQARDTALPAVHMHRQFRQFVEKELPALVAGKEALLAHPGPYPPCPANLHTPTVLAVGPESGFTDPEVDALLKAGFSAVQIGSRALRVETAVMALLGRLLPL